MALTSFRTSSSRCFDAAVHGLEAAISVARRDCPTPENNTVHAEYFAPIGFGPGRPGVIVLHILGADFPLSRYMAARMADRGIAALFVKLPYYGERRPPGRNGAIPSKRLVSADIERTMTAMRQAVLDVRRAACWLAAAAGR